MFDALLRKQSCEVFSRLIISPKFLCSDSAVVQSKPKIKALVQANTTRLQRKVKGQFIENLFLDKFDPKILEYPEIDTLVEYEILRKHYSLVQKLLSGYLSNESKVTEVESQKLLSTVKELEFTGFRVPRESGGFGYLNSEYTLMHEAFGQIPSLAKAISENEGFGIQLISSCGNEAQKAEYLPKLSTGQNIACFAHLETQPLVTRGSVSLSTTAVQTPDGYVVSGKKNWVYNATHADLVIFSANVISEDSEEESKPMLFIVDKNTSGLEVHPPFKLMGMKGLDVCEVSFNNVVVPSTSVLGGSELLKKALSKGTLNNGAQCAAIMRKLVNMAITHCIHNKFFKKNKYEKNYYKIKIGSIASRLYSVESMTYLLSGRLDSDDDVDVFLESLIGKIFASENLQFVLNQTLTILSSEGFLEDNGLKELIKDCQFYLACDDTNNHLRLVLSKAGCEHLLMNQDNLFIKLAASSRHFLYKIIWKLFDESIFRRQGVAEGHLHLMFRFESGLLEDSIFLLNLCATKLLKKYGDEVFDRHLELKFLADIAIHIYGMTAILARASRGFCLGMKNDSVDKNVTFAEVKRMHMEVLEFAKAIRFSKFTDARTIGSRMINCKNYSDQFPITENLMIRSK